MLSLIQKTIGNYENALDNEKSSAFFLFLFVHFKFLPIFVVPNTYDYFVSQSAVNAHDINGLFLCPEDILIVEVVLID